MTHRIKTLMALGCALLTAAASAQISPDRVLVVVNGEAIKGQQYYTRMEFLPNVGRLVNDRFVPAPPGFLALQQLINETLMIQTARSRGVAPTEAELNAAVARRKEENPDLVTALQRMGLADDTLRYEALVSLSEFKLLTQGITVTDFEVEKFYEDNAPMFTLPKRFQLRVINVLTDADKGKVDAALAAGRPFAEIATELSADVSKVDGGNLGMVPVDGLGTSAKPVVEATPKGQRTPWIRGQGSWAMFLVEDIKESEVVPMSDDLKRRIREGMMVDRGNARGELPKLMEDARKDARLDFQGTPFDAQLRQAFGK